MVILLDLSLTRIRFIYLFTTEHCTIVVVVVVVTELYSLDRSHSVCFTVYACDL